MMTRRLGDEGGYSMALWAIIISLVILPLMAFGTDVNRMYIVRTELQRAADAGALAGSRQIDVAHFRNTGEIRFLDTAYGEAMNVASLNAASVAHRGAHPRVDTVTLDNDHHTVTVKMSAAMEIVVPVITPNVTIHVSSTAQARSAKR